MKRSGVWFWPILAGPAFASAQIGIYHNSSSRLASAQSCLASWDEYSSSSRSYKVQHPTTTTETYTNAYTQVVVTNTPTTIVTSLTTLCDGHPRVVGQETLLGVESSYTISTTVTNTYTDTLIGSTYPGRVPNCTVATKDCSVFFSSWSSQCNIGTAGGYCTIDQPNCATTSYPTPTNLQTVCEFCQIVASGARLLYWPVTPTVDLCNNPIHGPASPTSSAPNVFITGSYTITSPTVAIALSGLSRVDGCGTTVGQTILAVEPDQLSSVRGYHAFFDWLPFNYTDLTWYCASNNTESSLPYSERSDCYQGVPANAYFGNVQQAIDVDFLNDSQRASLTIFPNYQPQLLIPQTMNAEITRLWGSGCVAHQDGVWDPPSALTPGTTIAMPTVPVGYNDPSITSAIQAAPGPSQTLSGVALSSTPMEQPTQSSMPTDATPTLATSHAAEQTQGGANSFSWNIGDSEGVEIAVSTSGLMTVEVVKVAYLETNQDMATQTFTMEEIGHTLGIEDVSLGTDKVVIGHGSSASTWTLAMESSASDSEQTPAAPLYFTHADTTDSPTQQTSPTAFATRLPGTVPIDSYSLSQSLSSQSLGDPQGTEAPQSPGSPSQSMSVVSSEGTQSLHDPQGPGAPRSSATPQQSVPSGSSRGSQAPASAGSKSSTATGGAMNARGFAGQSSQGIYLAATIDLLMIMFM